MQVGQLEEEPNELAEAVRDTTEAVREEVLEKMAEVAIVTVRVPEL